MVPPRRLRRNQRLDPAVLEHLSQTLFAENELAENELAGSELLESEAVATHF